MKLACRKDKVKKYAAIICAFIMTFAPVFQYGNIFAEENNSDGEIKPITLQDARDIHDGKITLKDGRADSLLMKRDVLDPEKDSDGDGLKNNEELFTVTENGKKYLHYKSHPLLADTDGDGIEDGKDSDPLKWDVSPRDAILFQELSYRDDDYVNTVLNDDIEALDLYEGRNEYRLMRNELSPYWKLEKSWHDTYNGFDADLFTFTNKRLPFLKNEETHVLAIRGTKDSLDRKADANIAMGLWPDQASSAIYLADYVEKQGYKDVYVTGHSLGGYLAQMFFVRSLGDNYGNPKADYPYGNPWHKNLNYRDRNKHNNTNVKQVFTFNAPRIKSSIFSPWTGEYSALADYMTTILDSKNYVVENDNITNMIGAFENPVRLPASEKGHTSRSFFEDKYIDVPGFSVGNRRGLSEFGYQDPAIKDLQFVKPTYIEFKDSDSDDNSVVSKVALAEKYQYQINNHDIREFLPEGYELENTKFPKIGETNIYNIHKKRMNITYRFTNNGEVIEEKIISVPYKTDYEAPEIPVSSNEKTEYVYGDKNLPKVDKNDITEDKVIEVPLEVIEK